MGKRTFSRYCPFVLLLLAGLYTGCGSTVSGTNCTVMCQDVDNTCVKNCNDDQCRSACTTDLDNCTASCGKVTVSPDGG